MGHAFPLFEYSSQIQTVWCCPLCYYYYHYVYIVPSYSQLDKFSTVMAYFTQALHHLGLIAPV